MEKVTVGGVPVTAPLIYDGFGGEGVGIIIPSGAPNGKVVWTNKYGTATWSGTFSVLYTPVVSSATPSSGGSGTIVDFTGTHLENIDPVIGGYVDSGSVDGVGHRVSVTNISATTARLTIPSITPMFGTCQMSLSLFNIAPGGMSTMPVNFALTGAPPSCP
jgi:hypothetical protein